MAIGDPQLRYATHTEVTDGIKTDFEINFVGGYINPTHVLAISVLVDEETGLTTDRQVHATEIISSSENAATVRISPAVEAGRTVVIFRSTPKTGMLVDYSNGSILSKANLDLANRQLLMLIQEMLDNVNEDSLTLREVVDLTLDLNSLITEIYEDVLELLSSHGIISVAPRVWSGVGDGETLDWPLVGADVDASGFYDTYVAGEGMEPELDYTILTSDTPADTLIRFTEPVPDGVRWFVVLRGYAKPYAGPPPINSMDIPVLDAEGTVFFADEDSRWALVRCTHVDGCTVTINEVNPTSEEPIRTGSFVSFMQRGLGPVVVEGDPAVTIRVPGGCLPRTRAENSIITAVCEDADSNLWVLSGDLALEE